MSGELARARARAGRAWRRVRSQPDIPLVTRPDEQMAQLAASMAELSATLARIESRLVGHDTWLTDLENGIGDVREAHGAQLADLSKWLGSAILTLTNLTTTPVVTSPELQAAAPPARRNDELAALRRQLQLWTTRAWLTAMPIEFDTLITVIMPTRDRAPFLREALASVLAQRHHRFELVVVDDGSEDETPEVLAAIDDPRVRVLRTTGLGESASRNIALEAATGTIVTFLDDDNLMDPGWLHAVAWVFDRWPNTQTLYGARIIEDAPAMDSTPSGALPNLDWEAFDRRRLEQGNYIDMNTIALRAELPALHFDETLRSSNDWQLMLTMSARSIPFELPAIACIYRTYAPNRVCDTPVRLEHNRRVRSRIHRTRPMRVLSHNAMFPLLSETYIHEEMLALEASGATIAFNSIQVPQSPLEVEQPVWHDLYAAVQEFDPDLLFVYWATHASGELANFERIGRPFALRVHSFDFDPEVIARVRSHPLCIGVWAYPHHAPTIDAHALVPLFTTHASIGAAADERNLVLSVSAGLPKKNWPLLIEAMAGVTELERGIVLARSNGFEEVPDMVADLASRLDDPPFVRVNATRAESFELLARTSVLIYTVADDQTIGMPMSIIEALRAGACVVHPDRPEFRHVAGPGYRGYRTADDIVTHIREIAAGGPSIDAEREANQAWAVAQFCDPALGARFHEEVAAALEAWRFSVG